MSYRLSAAVQSLLGHQHSRGGSVHESVSAEPGAGEE